MFVSPESYPASSRSLLRFLLFSFFLLINMCFSRSLNIMLWWHSSHLTFR